MTMAEAKAREHKEWCEIDGTCPVTGREECGRVVVEDQEGNPITVWCAGCSSTHNAELGAP